MLGPLSGLIPPSPGRRPHPSVPSLLWLSEMRGRVGFIFPRSELVTSIPWDSLISKFCSEIECQTKRSGSDPGPSLTQPPSFPPKP